MSFSTSGRVSLIVTLKPLWKKETLKLIIPRSITGLSTTHLPWPWRLKKISVLLLLRGGWMKPVSKLKGEWVYLYRAVDFILSERRNEAAATAFFKQVIDANGFPKKVIMDKSCANYVGLENINFLLMLADLISFVEILQIKYLNRELGRFTGK
jgi:DDE domain